MWGSRESWLADVDAWAHTGAGREVLARLNVRPAMLLRVADVLASHADHASGRHCRGAANAAAARAAHCSPRTVTTARASCTRPVLPLKSAVAQGPQPLRTSDAGPRYGIW